MLDTQDGSRGARPSPRRVPRVPAAHGAAVSPAPDSEPLACHEDENPRKALPRGARSLEKSSVRASEWVFIITNNESPEAKLFNKSTVVKGEMMVTQ